MHSPLSGVADEILTIGYFEPASSLGSFYCNSALSYGSQYLVHNYNKMERIHNYSSYIEPQLSISTSENYTRFSECFAPEQCFQSEVIDTITSDEFEIPESPESLSSSYNYRNTELCMRGDEVNCDFSGNVSRVDQCDRDCNELCLNYFVNNGNTGTWSPTIDDQSKFGKTGEFEIKLQLNEKLKKCLTVALTHTQ